MICTKPEVPTQDKSTEEKHFSRRSVVARVSKKVDKLAAAPPTPPVAVWRVHIHAARRRVMIIIITAQRLRRGHRHPSRLPRLDDMGWFIPCGLGDDRSSFIKEFLKFVSTREQVGVYTNAPSYVISHSSIPLLIRSWNSSMRWRNSLCVVFNQIWIRLPAQCFSHPHQSRSAHHPPASLLKACLPIAQRLSLESNLQRTLAAPA